MAFEKLYNELYAAVALLALAPELAGDLEKGESPDWVEPVRDMGVEVTQALRQQDGEAQRFLERYLGRRAEEIPPAAFERYAGALHFDHGRLWGLTLEAEQEWQAGYADRARYRFACKLEKLNDNYTPYAENALYLFLHTDRVTPAAAEALTADLRRIQQDAPRKFDRVFLDGVDCLYLGGLTQGGTERRAIPLAAAVRLREAAGFLRGVGEWQAGASVVKTLRKVALLREE